jgi:hypothetical protein
LIEFRVTIFISRLIVFTGIILVTAVNFFIVYKFESSTGVFTEDEMFASAIITLIVVSFSLGQFDEAIRATMMCLAVDVEQNGGVAKFGTPSFHDNIDKIREFHS